MEKRAHIVILPFAQQGHINPLMQLAWKLADRGARVTFVLAENTVVSGRTGVSKMPNLQIVGVADNLPAERSRGSKFMDSVDSMLNMEAGFRDLLQRLCDGSPGVSALIYDAFMTWAPSIASSLSLPFICFYTSNAAACSLAYRFRGLVERGIDLFSPELGLDAGKDAPLLPPQTTRATDGVPEDLSPEGFPDWFVPHEQAQSCKEFLSKVAQSVLECRAIVLNTMEELEPEAVAVVRAHRPVYTVGPLVLLSGRPFRVGVNYWPQDDHCLPWLDAHPPSSVLFASFGSLASLPLPQFHQLALGLEASKQPFLWVVRPDSISVPVDLALPPGFLARTKDRGLIISWGPQLSILSHPSIGAFLTHAGWNSIIENLSTGSVPMICWPQVGEQYLSCRLVVDYWKIGLRLQHEEDGIVAKEEIARLVCDLLQGERGKDLKNATIKVGDMAKKAVVANEGSSHKSFQALYDYATLPKDSAT